MRRRLTVEKNLQPRSDEEVETLVSTYAVGQKSGWHYLLTIAANSASRCLPPEDAQDVAQESALALYTRLKEGEAIHSPPGFIIKTARWKSLDVLKKKKPVSPIDQPSDKPPDSNKRQPSPDQYAAPMESEFGKDLDFALISECLSRIEPPCPDILKQHYCDGRPHKEVASILSIHAGGIRMRSLRCLDKLRKTLTKACPQYLTESRA